MLGHLHKAGYKCIVYNRPKSKAEKLMAEGVKWANSPEELAAQSDVREVYLSEQGIINSAKPGTVVIDMTTTEPSLGERTSFIKELQVPYSLIILFIFLSLL